MQEKQTLDTVIKKYHHQDLSLRIIQSDLVTWRIRLGCSGSALLYFLNLVIEPSSETLIKFIHVNQNLFNISLEILAISIFLSYLYCLRRVRDLKKMYDGLCRRKLDD